MARSCAFREAPCHRPVQTAANSLRKASRRLSDSSTRFQLANVLAHHSKQSLGCSTSGAGVSTHLGSTDETLRLLTSELPQLILAMFPREIVAGGALLI
jgi:hypothetical protein